LDDFLNTQGSFIFLKMNKSDFDWNMFIEIVRECEFLWNMALEDHKDKQKCKDAWTRISEQVGVGNTLIF